MSGSDIKRFIRELRATRAQAVALAEQTDALITRIEEADANPERAVLSLDEAAKMIGVHKNTVRKLIGNGKLVPISSGSRVVRVTRGSVEDYLDGKK